MQSRRTSTGYQDSISGCEISKTGYQNSSKKRLPKFHFRLSNFQNRPPKFQTTGYQNSISCCQNSKTGHQNSESGFQNSKSGSQNSSENKQTAIQPVVSCCRAQGLVPHKRHAARWRTHSVLSCRCLELSLEREILHVRHG